LSKAAAIATFGDAAVERWHRSSDVPPPSDSGEDAGYVTRDARYAHLLSSEYP
jgi:bisphosphoglycerate-dependent phosphoglycerate mutase